MVNVIASIKSDKNNCIGYLLKSGDQYKIVSKGDLFKNSKLIKSIDRTEIKVCLGDRPYIAGKKSKLRSISLSEAKRIAARVLKLNPYDSDFNDFMFRDSTHIILDVNKLNRHGATSFSSGALSKWDLNGFMIKGSGEFINSSINECFISEVLYRSGIEVAKYGLVRISYSDNGKNLEEIACMTKLFANNKTDSREILDTDNSLNDNVIKLYDVLNRVEKQKLVDMFVVDYITMQTDRHRKNIEFLITPNGFKLAPLYDFGCCFLHSYEDSILVNIGVDFPDRAKIESRTNLENIKFIRENLTDTVGFSPDRLYRNSNIVLNKYKNFYGKYRTAFISKMILGRCKIVRNLFGT